ncbi:MAG: TlpA disulfide reductase family protein [Bacteroidaceae bacterium]|nr:TlpA disulfide reductase family protein [Bacteroidaceae bacterium]
MKRLLLLAATLSMLAGCTHEQRFHIEGHISGVPSDTMLYLEHITLGDGIVAIDSACVGTDGKFEVTGTAPANPEFYRLRIGAQGINLAVDSTEHIHIEATLANLSFGYKVEGSGNCDTIRLLCLHMAELERQVTRIALDRSITMQERQERVDTLVAQYKQSVKANYMRNRYDASSSYFACFQMLGNVRVFDPMQDKNDLAWFRAIANAWNERYPDCPRTENLFNIVQQARKNQSKPRQITLDLDSEKVRELGIIDITLPDIKGEMRSLSDLKGQVVLLDFTAFSLEGMHERTLLLRELYNKYHDRGFEIYQVSVDNNHNFWAQRTEMLPWVSVYCEEGANSDILKLYQVGVVPYYFLIDRNCDLQARQEHITDLEKAIEALL